MPVSFGGIWEVEWLSLVFLEVEWHCVIGEAEILGVWEHGHGQSGLLA
jgi:hypothetical protein